MKSDTVSLLIVGLLLTGAFTSMAINVPARASGELQPVSTPILFQWVAIEAQTANIDSIGEPDFYYEISLYQNQRGSNYMEYIRSKRSAEPLKSGDGTLTGSDFGDDSSWNLGSDSITIEPDAYGTYSIGLAIAVWDDDSPDTDDICDISPEPGNGSTDGGHGYLDGAYLYLEYDILYDTLYYRYGDTWRVASLATEGPYAGAYVFSGGDDGSNGADDAYDVLVAFTIQEGYSDTIAPVTTAHLTPAEPNGENGWYTTDVEVNLTAVDNYGGTGVDTTYYMLNNGTYMEYDTPFIVSTEGVNNITYFSFDASNVEDDRYITIRIDSTSPAVSISPDTASGSESVSVLVEMADNTSGLWSYEYCWSNSTGIPVTGWQNSALSGNNWQVSLDIATAGSWYLHIRARDRAGNTVYSLGGPYTVTIGDTSNLPPVLMNGSVSPESGDENTEYTFTVEYTDPDGDTPAKVQIVIDDGTPVPMAPAGGNNTLKYKYVSYGLSPGTHTYYFIASDGRHPDVYYPGQGKLYGPTVTETLDPDFTITLLKDDIQAYQGESAVTTVHIEMINGFASQVSLSCSGLPSGALYDFTYDSVSGSGDVILTLTAGEDTPAGEYNIIVSGQGGGLTREAYLKFTVLAVEVPQPAISGNITSLYHNFFLADMDLYNEFYVNTVNTDGLSDVKVYFTLDGYTKTGKRSGDTWTGGFNMKNAHPGSKLEVELSVEGKVVDNATMDLNVIEMPGWMSFLIKFNSQGEPRIVDASHDSVNRKWRLDVKCLVPYEPLDISFSVPDIVPVFAGSYKVHFQFITEFTINSDREVDVGGSIDLSLKVFKVSGSAKGNIEGRYVVANGTIEWRYMKVYLDTDVFMPSFSKSISLKLFDNSTVISGKVALKLKPKIALGFALQPTEYSTGGYTISGFNISIEEITGKIGITGTASGSITIYGVKLIGVSASASVDIFFDADQPYMLDHILMKVSLAVTLNTKYIKQTKIVNLGYTYDYYPWKEDTRGGMMWDTPEVIDGAGEVEIAGANETEIAVKYTRLSREIMAPPQNLTREMTPEGLKIAWDPVPNATGYNIYRTVGDGSEILLAENVSGTEYTDNITGGGAYYYRVTALLEKGTVHAESDYSSQVVYVVDNDTSTGDGGNSDTSSGHGDDTGTDSGEGEDSVSTDSGSRASVYVLSFVIIGVVGAAVFVFLRRKGGGGELERTQEYTDYQDSRLSEEVEDPGDMYRE